MSSKHQYKLWILCIGLFILGVLIGWWIAPVNEIKEETSSATSMSHSPEMMQTMALEKKGVYMSAEAIALSQIECTTVASGQQERSMRVYGTIVPDANQTMMQPAHFSGRVDTLFIKYRGQSIKSGQPIASLYSPELITAQQELLQAYATRTTAPIIYNAARMKMKEFQLSDKQIDHILAAGTIQQHLRLLATVNGVVNSEPPLQGSYVKQGEPLFQVANLSKLWVDFYIFENQLPFVTLNDTITFQTDALPGKQFKGRIIFISPTMDGANRTTTVRMAISNPMQMLKPQMYVYGDLNARASKTNKLIIPHSSVLWTGTRSVVYVRTHTQPDIFQMRQITLGNRLDNGFEVIDGLQEGEIIATQGVFCIDAAAQLEGKPNMLNPQGNPNAEKGGMGGMKM
ncbi:MAG: efflux RND transporter periplasmic adaptor subunit [Marinifilaceae bacterium]